MLNSPQMLHGVTLTEITFTTIADQSRWYEPSTPYRECPARTPLEPNEVIEFEVENDQGDTTWWTGLLTGRRAANPSRYGIHCLRLACEQGSPEALRAAEQLLNASWLQQAWLQTEAQGLSLLQAFLLLPPGEGMNLREEGHAQRVGDAVQLWTGLRYFNAEPPDAQVPWAEWSEVLTLNLTFLDLRAAVERSVLAALEDADLPEDDALPRYVAGRGFLNAHRWHVQEEL